MARSLLQAVSEFVGVVSEVAKQHDVYVRVIAFGVFVSAHASLLNNSEAHRVLQRILAKTGTCSSDRVRYLE